MDFPVHLFSIIFSYFALLDLKGHLFLFFRIILSKCTLPGIYFNYFAFNLYWWTLFNKKHIVFCVFLFLFFLFFVVVLFWQRIITFSLIFLGADI